MLYILWSKYNSCYNITKRILLEYNFKYYILTTGFMYYINIFIVKIIMTWGQSAVVMNKLYSKATQRLHAKNLNSSTSFNNSMYPYIIGIIDGIGKLNIIHNKYLLFELTIELPINNIKLLYKIKKILGVGTIKIYKNELENNQIAIFSIKNKKHLKEIIIPIFDKYPLLSLKYYDYINFRKYLMNDIKYDNFNKDNINSIIYPEIYYNHNRIIDIINTTYFESWLLGFIETKGIFNINIDNNISFEISQINDEIIILAIKEYFNINTDIYIDNISEKVLYNNYIIKTTNIKSIENIIKYMNNNPIKLLGIKKVEYIKFLSKLRKIKRYNEGIIIPNKY